MAESQLGLDYFGEDRRAGFRLDRLEILNWGTFHQHVWTLRLNGENGLLTGDIGTGKSTLVDAVTTLLVPAHQVTYNKAAGAASRERTLRSYVMGHYKSERADLSDSSGRPVSLRDKSSYSVILGVFQNAGYSQSVTLAQVFWMDDRFNQPRRFYAAAERDMSIEGEFSRFGTEVAKLRKRLRHGDVQVWDSFPPYGAWFRRRLGIHNEQALELFHQTVSMKSVGNLTDFVRSHMLEPFDASKGIEALMGHFDDLNQAYKTVLRAKRQIELLSPLVEDCDQHADLSRTIIRLERTQAALTPYFATHKLRLVTERINAIRNQRSRQEEAVRRCEERKASLAAKKDSLNRDIASHGGDRLNAIDAKVKELVAERRRRERRSDEYAQLLEAVDERKPSDSETYETQRRTIAELAEQARVDRDRVQHDLTERTVSLRKQQSEHDRIAGELESLRARTTNIPREQVEMRQKLCHALQVEEDALPFVGELLGVSEDSADWEGAAERVLRNFGLSLLVSDRLYPYVAAWVDKTHLHGRLVYYRAREQRGALPELHPESLVRKLSIRPDSDFRDWLRRELALRFDLACCATQEAFRQEPQAITRSGQVKLRGERHEKDDRFRIDDRARFVLGWENAAKIRAIEAQVRLMATNLADAEREIEELESQRNRGHARADTLSRLESFPGYREIDWESVAAEIAGLTAERQQIESASDMLQVLRNQLEQTRRSFDTVERELTENHKALGRIDENLRRDQQIEQEVQASLADSDLDAARPYFERLGKLLDDSLGAETLCVRSCDTYERRLRQSLKGKSDAAARAQSKLQDRITQAMTRFSEEYLTETRDFEPSIESASEYRDLLVRLRDDGLPHFEAQFKELLNENTIREVASFQSLLDRERETIKGRIEQINDSLAEIDYNPGRYIKLLSQASTDQEIREFRRSLKECTEGSMSGSDSDQYSEWKFLRVQAVIERLRGRDKLAELDRRWVAKVTDVRNWFVFGVSERWREGDSEYEHYSDSGGKSGGQKEKLAYTVLAASLSYQFGLESGAVRSRSFRFVVIDEAFGRGSDESTRYALSLFSKLRLQLLIVTPLQKIHIIEPYVESVGFVQIKDNRNSRLRNLSISEYRQEKQRIEEAAGVRPVMDALRSATEAAAPTV